MTLATRYSTKRNDLLPSITDTLTDVAGAPVNLTGATVRFLMRDMYRLLKVNSPAVIVTPAAGTVRYDWQPGDTNTAGAFQAEWEVTFGSGKPETFPPHGFITVAIDEDVDVTQVPDAELVTITDLVTTLQMDVAALPSPAELAVDPALSSRYTTVTVAIGAAFDRTGAVDCATALNALIAAVSAAGGGRVHIPKGNYKLATSLTPLNNVTVTGDGVDVTVLWPLHEGFRFEGAAGANPLVNFHLSDLTVDGTNMTSTYKGYHGQFHKRCSWENLRFCNTQQTGLGPDFLVDCLILNVLTENTGLGNDGTQASGNGIGIGGGGYAAAGVGTGWDDESFLVTGCTVINAKRFGFLYEGGETQSGARFIGNSASGCGNVTSGDAGFSIAGGRGAIVHGNHSYNNVGAGFHIGTATVASSLAGSRGRVSNNYAENNGTHGIYYESLTHAPVPEQCFAITNNVCGRNVLDGIRVSIASDTMGLDIQGNLLYANGNYGLNVMRTGTTAIMTALRVDGNTFIRNVGAPTFSYQLTVAVHTTGSSISRNVFESTSGAPKTCVALGIPNNTAVHTNLMIHGNNANGRTFLYVWTNHTLVGCSVRDNLGYNPQGPAAITVTASPFTYTAGYTPETVYIDGGTVSAIVKGGVTLRTSTGTAVQLAPNEAVVVTYSVLPTMVKDRL
jgi:hypothetical protein